MRYFKKVSPATKVLLSNGVWLAFQNVDNEFGIYPPEGQGISEWLIGEIRACIEGHRGGITEIELSEYNELVQKKNNRPLPKQWREEMGKGAMLQTASESNPNAPHRADLQPVAGARALQNPRPVEQNLPERPSAGRIKPK